MKRVAITLLVLFVATSLFAGGKNCDLNKSAKNVTLTGSLATSGSGDDAKTIFRVADGKSYSVCHETKASVLKLGSDGSRLEVKGKVVNCGDGEELVITEAKKI